MATATVQLPDGTIAEVPIPEPKQDMGRNLARQAFQGLSLGFGDEFVASQVAAAASINELLHGRLPNPAQLRRDVLETERIGMERFREEHPGKSIAANIGGGLLTGKAVFDVTKGVVAQAPVLLQGATAAGVTGGIAGAGTGETPVERITEGAKGAALSALLGAASDVVGAVAQKARPTAAVALRKFAERTGIKPERIEAELAKQGPGSVLADVDESLRQFARGSTQTSNNFSAIPRLQERSRQAFGRISGVLQRTTGAGSQRASSLDELATIRKEQASPIYQRLADSQPEIANTPAVNRLIKNHPDIRAAWARVKRRGQGEIALNDFADEIAEGAVVADPQDLLRITADDLDNAMPSFAGLHHIQQDLNGKIGAARRAGNSNRVKELTRAKKAVHQIMDKASPDYKEARRIWAGTKRAEELIDLGEDFVKAPLSRQKQILSELDEADREIFSIGLGTAIEDRIARQVDTGDISRLFRNPQVRQQLSGVLGSRRKTAELARAIKTEQARQETLNAVRGGSKTAANQATGEILAGSQTPAAGSALEVLERLVRKGVVKGPNASQIADMLLSDDPIVQQQALKIMREAGQPGVSALGGSVAGQIMGLQ